MPLKCIICYFLYRKKRKKKKSVCLPFLNFLDLFLETHILYLALNHQNICLYIYKQIHVAQCSFPLHILLNLQPFYKLDFLIHYRLCFERDTNKSALDRHQNPGREPRDFETTSAETFEKRQFRKDFL